MRALALVLLIAAAALGAAQSTRREGSYAPVGGKPVDWRIDENHDLVWGGARYTPVGVRVEGNPAAVDAANAAGVKDLLIDLPVGGDWNATIDAAEKNGQRYLVRLSSLAPGAAGVAVDPAAYRVAGLTGPKHLDLALPGASDALVVVALQRDGSVASQARVPVVDGRLVVDTKVNAGLENVILIYPRTPSLELPDLWEGMDGHRDALLARLRRTHFGPGLRGVMDPLGSAARLPGQEVHAVPTSPAFHAQLAANLESKYLTLDSVMKGWSMSASSLSTAVSGANGKRVEKTTFTDLARLVPLWSGGRGVGLLWDPSTNKTFACDRGDSQIWTDIDQAVAAVASRRVQRLCAAIRRVVDVPVVQEWNGWVGVTEDRQSPFDGVAARASGETPSELMDSAARAVSTVARWSTRGWLVASDVTVPSKTLPASLDDLAGIGLRAAFVDAAPGEVKAVAAQRAAAPPADVAIDPLFFPENAANPAAVQRLPGGRWWLPTPEDGNRLDFGDSFYGYRIATPQGNRIVIWAKTTGRYLLRMVKPADTVITTMDGSDSEAKVAKNGLVLTIGQVPVVIDGVKELPVPEISLKETLEAFTRLTQVADNGRRVGTDESFVFTDAVAAFDINPGGSYTAMRQQLRKFASKLSPVAWVEAEAYADTTFSEVAPMPGASGDRALVLRATLPTDDGYVANYRVPVASRDEVVLWVAAKLPPERRRELEATIGGVTLVATERPVSAYGAGFAWYRMGTTRLTGGVANVSFRMRSGVGSEAALDAIVFAPADWRPNGVAYPYAFAGR